MSARLGWLLGLALLALALWLALPVAAANVLNVRAMRVTLAAEPPAGSAPALPDWLDGRVLEQAQVRLDLVQGSAQAALARADDLHPLRCDLAILAGNATDAQGRAGAIDFWDDCPQAAAYLVRRGDDTLIAGDEQGALGWYARAASLPAGSFDTSLALLKQGRLLRAQGEGADGWAQALPVYETYRTLREAGTLPPLRFDVRTLREVDMWDLLAVGHALREQEGGCARARFWYELAEARAPASAYPAIYLGVCAEETGERLAWFEQAIAREPQNDRGYYWMAQTLEQADDCATALTWYADAAARNPQEINALLGMGRCAEATGDHAAARDAYQRVLALRPNNAAAQGALERIDAGGAP